MTGASRAVAKATRTQGNTTCFSRRMTTIKKQMKRHLGKKATRRIYTAMPWVGGVLALAVGTVVQKRGVRGALDDLRDIPSSVSGGTRRSSRVAEPDNDFVGSH